MEKEKKEIKISLWTFYVLVAAIVVLIGAVVIGALNVQKQQNNKQNGETVGNNEQGQQQVADVDKIEQLNVNSELVQELYNYVGETSDYYSLSMYQTEKTNNKNIPNKTKLLTAIRRALMDNLGKEEKVTNKVELAEYNNEKGLIINGYSEWDRTPEQYTTFADTMTYLDSTVVEKYVKKIFGQDATVTHEDASFIFGEKVMYENGKYKIFQYEGGGGTNWFDLKEIVKAEKKGNEIYIYDNYIRSVEEQVADFEQHMDYGIMKFYASSEQKMKIAELNEKTNQQDFMTIINEYEWADMSRFENILNTTLPQYKHTFKQADNGEYYWVSTELINEDELKRVEGDHNNKQANENIILYNGYELKVRYDEEIILEDMEYTSENIEKYEKSYYNYENGKYIGITNGIVEESFEGYCTVSNVSKFALSQQYNAMPRTARLESKFKYSQGDEYANKSALVVDLDGDGKDEYIVALSSNDYPHKSEIIILDYNLNKIETLVKRDKGHWTNYSGEESEINVLSLEDVELIDLDNDNIIEIVINTMVWDCTSVLIYKYENGAIKGLTNYNNELTI